MSSSSVNDYLFLDIIGVGSNATVFKAIKKDKLDETLAIKCIDASKISKKTIDNIIKGTNSLKLLEHENIVKLKDFFMTESRMFFVMEYCDGESIEKIISNHIQLPPMMFQTILQEIGLGLQYLYSNNISHLNLKPKNLLIVKKPSFKLKVGDYGFAQHLSKNEYKLNIHGSPLYKAPEILLDNNFDNRVDLWSVGVIMYECLFGKPPYAGLIEDLTDKIKQCHPIEIPQIPRISNECKHLLTSLLQHSLEYRLTFKDFLTDKFLDLEHAPCEENFRKAKKLIQDAGEFHDRNKLKEAFYLYKEALNYFVPMLSSEVFKNRKGIVKLYIHELMYRVERIRLMIRDDFPEDMPKRPRELTKPPIYYNIISQRLSPLLIETLGLHFEKLLMLSRGYPEMYEGLLIGQSGVYFLVEGRYDRAADSFQRALHKLIPILRNEPSGSRRNLLKNQVDFWVKLKAASISHFTSKDIYTNIAIKSRDFCVLQ